MKEIVIERLQGPRFAVSFQAIQVPTGSGRLTVVCRFKDGPDSGKLDVIIALPDGMPDAHAEHLTAVLHAGGTAGRRYLLISWRPVERYIDLVYSDTPPPRADQQHSLPDVLVDAVTETVYT